MRSCQSAQLSCRTRIPTRSSGSTYVARENGLGRLARIGCSRPAALLNLMSIFFSLPPTTASQPLAASKQASKQASKPTQGWHWTGGRPGTGIRCGWIPAKFWAPEPGSRLFLTSRDRWLACPGRSRLNERCWAEILCCCVSDNHKSDKSHHKRAGSANLSPCVPCRKCFTWC